MTPHKIGSVNATTLAVVTKRGRVVGYCPYTTNAIAYALAALDADRVDGGMLGATMRRDVSANRLAARGWMKSDADAGLVRS